MGQVAEKLKEKGKRVRNTDPLDPDALNRRIGNMLNNARQIVAISDQLDEEDFDFIRGKTLDTMNNFVKKFEKPRGKKPTATA